MPTGQQVVNGSLKVLGVLELGGTPSASESADSLDALNIFWDAWGIDEGLIFAEETAQYDLTVNVGSYAIGPTASSPFNVPRPSRIYRAAFVTATGRTELKLVTAQQYFSHGDLSASATTPDELYADFDVGQTSGEATLYLWPVQAVTGSKLEMQTGATFGTWALGTNYNIPQGYRDAIEQVLAWRLIPRFSDVVPEPIAREIAAQGEKAELRLRKMNAANRQVPIENMMLVPPQAAKGAQ